jgi:uncharacterized RDD family membrane protein YckC
VADQSFCAACGTPTRVTAGGVAPMPNLAVDVMDASTIVGLASFWRRLSGFLIDSIILGIAISLPLRHYVASVDTVSFLTVLVAFIYGDFFMTFGGGATLGMRAVGTRAVDAVTHAPLTPAQGFRRALAYSALLLVGSLYHAHTTTVNGERTLANNDLLLVYLFNIPHVLDLLWVAWDDKKQALHDKFAHSVVLHASRSTARS